MTITWNIRPEDVWPRIVQAQVDAIEADIVTLVNSLLDPVQEWMKANHRWQNRTGAAETGLYTDLLRVARQSVHLLMSHGPTISYSVYLEYGFAGRLSILGDTADNFWPLLYRGAVEIVRRHSS